MRSLAPRAFGAKTRRRDARATFSRALDVAEWQIRRVGLPKGGVDPPSPGFGAVVKYRRNGDFGVHNGWVGWLLTVTMGYYRLLTVTVGYREWGSDGDSEASVSVLR